MKIKKIEFKNFTSYGNRVQTIELTDSGFYLVLGENGWGKSTISDVIKFILYGTLGPNGRKLKDIPNRINGGAWGKITLETNQGKLVEVERGLEPTTISLVIDGEPYKKAGTKGPSDYLADELLEIPFHIFNNIISLSVNDFKSFLSMDAESKRKIIDKLFGFHIINMMREILKEQLSQLKRLLDDASVKTASAQRSIDESNRELESLLAKIQEKNVELIEKTTADLDKYRKLFEMHNNKQAEFTTKERLFKKDFEQALSEVNRLRSIIEAKKQQLQFYTRNDVCPTCGSDLHSSHGAIERKTTYQTDLDAAVAAQTTANEALAAVRSRESEIEAERHTILEKGSKIRSGIDQLTRTLQSLTADGPKDEQADSIRAIIARLEDQLTESTQARAQTQERINWLKLLDDTLSDKGVKQLALKAAVVPLNNEITQLMLDMHMEHSLYFDEEFDAHVTHLGEEIAIPSLSTGERKKVDFVALIALIRLMKTRYPGVNLLFLDEIFSSIDSGGIQSILKVLNKSCQDLSLNVFVISHNPLPREVFDFVVNIDKRNGFSTLSVEAA